MKDSLSLGRHLLWLFSYFVLISSSTITLLNQYQKTCDNQYVLDKCNLIKHISVYMLEEYYYPWNWKKNSISDIDYLWEYIEVKEYLEKRWYNRYELSNFSKEKENPLQRY